MQVRSIVIGAALSCAMVTAVEASAKPQLPAAYRKAVAASMKAAKKQAAHNPKVKLVNKGPKVRPAVRKPSK